MENVKKLLKYIEEYNEKYTVTENSSNAEKLVDKIRSKKYSNEEYLKLEEEVKAFLKSDSSEEDKQKVRGYAESLYMICSAIREGRLNV